MTKDLQSILQAPEWSMDDAYGSVGSEKWNQSIERAAALLNALHSMERPVAREALADHFKEFDEANTLISSLAAFAKCQGAKDAGDEEASAAAGAVGTLQVKLEAAALPLFEAAEALPADDALWQSSPLADWRFVICERKNEWHRKLSPSDREWLSDFEEKCFLPLGAVFKTLQKGVDFEAENSQGESERIRAAKLVSVIKGAPDRTLRRNVNIGLAKSYGERAELYAALLNELHGFRLAAFGRAGVDAVDVSLAQNRMSRGALFAMREAIVRHLDEIREAVRLRAPYFEKGARRLAVYDLMAPAPQQGKNAVPADSLCRRH